MKQKNFLISLVLILIIFFIINYLFEIYNLYNNEYFENIRDKDVEFLEQCFEKKNITNFSKYFKLTNVTKIKKNNRVIGMVFDTDNKYISETPNVDMNGLFISHLCIDKKFRKRGNGKLLVNNIIEKARDQGYSHIILLVKDDNIKALKLYENLGFDKYKDVALIDNTNGAFYIKYL